MSKDTETVRLQTEVPEDVYEELRDKLPVMTAAGDSNLLRFIIQQWLADRELETMEAVGQYQPGRKITQVEQDSDNK